MGLHKAEQNDFRFRWAYRDIMFLKGHLEKLDEWEQNWLLWELENFRITETECIMSRKEFNTLQIIIMNLKKKGVR